MSATEHRHKGRHDGSPSGNRILARLGASDRARIALDLDDVTLEFKETLYEQDRPITHVYFPSSSVVSLITLLTDGSEPIETGTVGHEGMVGLPAFLAGSRAPGRAVCQIAGGAQRMTADQFGAAVERTPQLHTLLLRYTNSLLTMMGQSAACNRVHDTRARMARWLLMTRDRVQRNEFPLTQEFLGQMLGVRRPAVSAAGSALQRDRLIRYARGQIEITDGAGLERTACECYAHVRAEFARSFDGLR